MTSPSQKLAVEKHREKIARQGLARFEVVGLKSDRELVRSLARKLAKKDNRASQLRAQIADAVDSGRRSKGALLAALRASPLVGADFDFSRTKTLGRKVGL